MKTNGIVILFILSIGCKDTRRLQPYSDPFLDSFREKNIHFMLTSLPEIPSMVDTTTFDKNGNVVKVRQFGSHEFRSYGSSNFITRLLILNDVPANYFIEYYFDKKGYLVQKWNTLNHLKWDFQKSDIKEVYQLIKFEIDSKGRIIKEIDSAANRYYKYNYNEQNRLIIKQGYLIKENSPSYGLIYSYDGLGQLNKMSIVIGGVEQETYHFENGLLQFRIKEGEKVEYRYIYY